MNKIKISNSNKKYIKDLYGIDIEKEINEAIKYELSHDKRGLNKYIGDNYYHIHSDELTGEEKEIHRNLLNNKLIKLIEMKYDNIEIKYYNWGFECPNIDNLKTKEQQDEVYNKILNLFEKELKNWIYKN